MYIAVNKIHVTFTNTAGFLDIRTIDPGDDMLPALTQLHGQVFPGSDVTFSDPYKQDTVPGTIFITTTAEDLAKSLCSFFGYPTSAGVSVATTALRHMSYIYDDTPPPECQHQYVNMGFSSLRMVCKFCDQEQ